MLWALHQPGTAVSLLALRQGLGVRRKHPGPKAMSGGLESESLKGQLQAPWAQASGTPAELRRGPPASNNSPEGRQDRKAILGYGPPSPSAVSGHLPDKKTTFQGAV